MVVENTPLPTTHANEDLPLRAGAATFESAVVSANIIFRLSWWAREGGIGWVLAAPVPLALPSGAEPDPPPLAFVSSEHPPTGSTDGLREARPRLIAEVVNPTTGAAYLHSKSCDYIRAGVPLVWVVFPSSRTVEAFRSTEPLRQVFQESDILKDDEVLPGFSVPVSELFAGLDEAS